MKKKELIVSICLVLVCIVYTLLVKYIDVTPNGPEGSMIGFSTINNAMFNLTKLNPTFYDISKYLGLIPFLVAGAYGLLGLVELIKRKSIWKVDRELLLLGAFFVCVVLVYCFFEVVVINYRPIAFNGDLEASFPSSHTLMAITILGSVILTNTYKYVSKKTKYLNYILFIVMLVIVFSRLLSGAHWLTDIVGGMLISITMLYIFKSILTYKKISD